jgi:predicted ATP-grasp superfamily ATP-dependent carboligase
MSMTGTMSMKLLLIESVTAGACDRPLQRGLLEEAELMLAAMVAETLAGAGPRRAGLASRLLRRADLPSRAPDAEIRVPIGGWSVAWPGALADVDAVWLVAPESGGELAALSRQVEAHGARLLGPSSAAVVVAGSKSACHAALLGRVRQPCDVTAGDGWVIKPDDGVAAEGVRRFRSAPEAVSGRQDIVGGTLGPTMPDMPSGQIVQPFVAGEALSLCVLSDGQAARVLSVNRQHIAWGADGRARYCGGVTNAIASRDRFLPMVRAVQAAIPGLWGCWGVDLVMPADGQPVLIEVNPRLTTAFAHLRAAIGFDLLGAVLALAAGQPLASLPQVPAGHAVGFRLADAVEAAP